MNQDELLRLWKASKHRIETCHECLDRWPSRVEQTLLGEEIPNPQGNISILFVGVAPPPIATYAGVNRNCNVILVKQKSIKEVTGG